MFLLETALLPGESQILNMIFDVFLKVLTLENSREISYLGPG